ncbi:Glycoside hydrolase family 3 [Neofusicoccum parvum]|uniref:Glycoside hydrolase family 3 n=1 Tax=Neofusicoccum parvum TaxID=310453 RepID=A0ACB5SF19_9PEZI|nr:Glycoside hydrolase family 3 [Neofusicoccum parvum]
MGHGNREIMEELLMPFKAAVDLGGVRGVMMAYNELDDVPAHVSPMLYQALEDWGYDGFVMGDDLGVSMMEGRHQVSTGPADTLEQWFNAGGMIQFYDYSLQEFLNITSGLVSNGSVPLSTLQAHVRKILSVKYDLGLFDDPYISESIDPQAITNSHVPLTLEAAQKSLVLLQNRNSTLPLKPAEQNIKKIALIGPFVDTLNYGDYSGPFGASPVANSSTLHQAMLSHLATLDTPCELVTAWGANQWLYNQQVPIPGYHLSPLNGSGEGLTATYFADTNFSTPLVQTVETPFLDWGLYPPPGLPSNNFSATWEGFLTVPSTLVDTVEGFLGVAVSANTTATLYVDGTQLISAPLTTSGNFLSNIEPRTYTLVNSTLPPPGSTPFTFVPGARHHIRITYTAYNLHQKLENLSSLNAQLLLFWNLVDPHTALTHATTAATTADATILHLGSSWSSDGEGGDRATLSLSPNQTALAAAVLAAAKDKPVVLVLTGGRPLAVPDLYARVDAVLASWFPGQSGGRAVADALFGVVAPGGRLPVSVPRGAGQLPVYYDYKYTAHAVAWLDEEAEPEWPFGWGLGYGEFAVGGFGGGVRGGEAGEAFGAGDYLEFRVTVRSTGEVGGSYVVQVYLLQRVSRITQPVRQLVAFSRVYLEVGEEREVVMEVEVDRYLRILNRRYEWEVEKGDYTFAVLEHGGLDADTGMNVTIACV